jgi:hypothetical protein
MTLGRIARVIDHAINMGWRSGGNPADWGTVFKGIAPERPSGDRRRPMLPWPEAPAAVARLRRNWSMGALAAEFAILTVTRASEASEARWREIDLAQGLWTIPPERTAQRREHVVPLSERALAILRALHERRRTTGCVFPGLIPGRPVSHSTVSDACLEACGGRANTAGWRATFRSWTADHGVPAEVADACLAHQPAACQRSALIERRKAVMDGWDAFLGGESEDAALSRRALWAQSNLPPPPRKSSPRPAAGSGGTPDLPAYKLTRRDKGEAAVLALDMLPDLIISELKKRIAADHATGITDDHRDDDRAGETTSADLGS